MLRIKGLVRLFECRNLHHCNVARQKVDRPDASRIGQANHFKDEEDVTSVQERALFEQVFENIMKKEELRKKNSSDIFLDAFSIDTSDGRSENGSDGKRLQVVFEKKNEEIQATDKKLFDFFKNTSGNSGSGDIGESAKLTTDDIRNYPVSLVSSIFADTHEKNANETTSLSSGKFLKNMVESPTKEIRFQTGLDLRLSKEVLKKLEAKERFKAAIGDVLKPYLSLTYEKIETDYDLLEYVRTLLHQYTNRDKSSDVTEISSPDSILTQISEQCEVNNKVLPQPYRITLPYILVNLLQCKEFNFPSERNYTIASYIYRECKRNADISLYLNVCNVDFYNLLLKLSWDNFREIHQLKQLTTEMSINGIRGDIHTIEILDKVVHDLRHLNDGIFDEETGKIEGNQLAIGVVWCRENSMDLMTVENYLKKLKESLI
ncbi:hypothetical protein HG535_0C02910 [Zygotorulaspora mrakii]|uniref:Mtf2-like C-terminal domain-containing protein n=1 Tax=Zygotorulaspora mrakii TaxID=42260 RepID=A0A7H9B1T4_ZYGMR|nr:uncharacterized protein HG535_0C02910 [Zygotorulaspora mrakii]QLG71939.1 hypothetical protein HG535_0C02910 [Zygotorulaspora mrakii]